MNKFKFLAIFGLFVLFLTGCAPSQSVVAFDPYKAAASQQNSGFEAYISAVHDNRKNKSTIATITDSKGTVKEYVVLQNDLATYFSDSLKKELMARGANINGMGGVVVEIFINEFEANMSGYGTDNTKGNIKITLKIQKGDQSIVKNISNNQTKFELIPTGGAFKSFLTEIINDAIKRTAIAILNS
ncbi:YajG family lipoprotein [Campylobacter concisus]|jgi:putative lipoprotein|uniref:YajG family lipoprotein n=1 Tax=Campylobacter concisus TaxID=199 RepID=UPI000D30D140|nr:YajG family lipoprotein [Campylobacter concisus]